MSKSPWNRQRIESLFCDYLWCTERAQTHSPFAQKSIRFGKYNVNLFYNIFMVIHFPMWRLSSSLRHRVRSVEISMRLMPSAQYDVSNTRSNSVIWFDEFWAHSILRINMIQIFLDLVMIEQILNVNSELCSKRWPFGNLL